MRDRISTRLYGEYPRGEAPEGEVVEVPLLLPGWQVSALERAAHRRGLTAGEMLRSVLGDFIARLPAGNGAAPSELGRFESP